MRSRSSPIRLGFIRFGVSQRRFVCSPSPERARGHVEGGNLLGQDNRVTVVVRKDHAPNPQAARHAGNRRERGYGGQMVPERLFDKVVSKQEGRVASVLPGRGPVVQAEMIV